MCSAIEWCAQAADCAAHTVDVRINIRRINPLYALHNLLIKQIAWSLVIFVSYLCMSSCILITDSINSTDFIHFCYNYFSIYWVIYKMVWSNWIICILAELLMFYGCMVCLCMCCRLGSCCLFCCMFFRTSFFAHLSEELIMMTFMLVCSGFAFIHCKSNREHTT